MAKAKEILVFDVSLVFPTVEDGFKPRKEDRYFQSQAPFP